MNIYNARLCSEMAGFVVDAALIFILQNISQKLNYDSKSSARVCAKPLPPLSKSCFCNVVSLGGLESSALLKPKLHGFYFYSICLKNSTNN